jgi:hypothetical protein
VRQIRIQHDRPTRASEFQRGVANENVVWMAVERARGVDDRLRGKLEANPLNDLMQRQLGGAVLIVEQTDLH